MARRDEIKHPDPVLAVDFGLRMTFDTLDQATLFADVQRSTIKLTPEQLAEELTRAFLSYLGVETPPAWEPIHGKLWPDIVQRDITHANGGFER